MSAHKKEAEWIRDQVIEHHQWFERSLPMIASENLISPMAREMLTCDFHDRYAEGLPGERYYQGLIYVDEVERKVTELAKKLYKCDYADPRPTSGTNANLGVFFALGKPGEVMTSVAVPHGAHITSAKFGAAGVRGLITKEYPYIIEDWNIDVDKTIKFIKEEKPKFCLFGQSVFLFPTPLKELEEAFKEVACPVVYDGAHVMGLIAGGQFQDPLREGAHILNGSTHKTFPGPQHGLIVANPRDKKMKNKLIYGMFPGVLSNHHLHAMASLGIALCEFLDYGKDYTTQVVKNAQKLGEAMHERGFKVMCSHLGFTRSHTIAVDVKEWGGGKKIVEDLEKANVITNKNLMPWDDVGAALDPSGIRLGSQELTRLGMKESEMVEVAEIFTHLAIDKRPIEEVKQEVIELRKGFNTIKYCYHEDIPAYKYHNIVPL